ncbi:MAG: glycosyltransferase family 4 protein [Desulfovibrionales bacterium]|nr:glycosyltransferase family 4 protein [Desulfovibrionales bacterium]
MPSRSANSIHVARMCQALIDSGHQVTLFVARSIRGKKEFQAQFESFYGYDIGLMQVTSFYIHISKALISRIAVRALIKYLADAVVGCRPDLVISRNLCASFIIGVLLRRRLVFETHQPEGGWRKYLQRALMRRPWVTTVAISEALLGILGQHHGFLPARYLVLHDAAPHPGPILSPTEKLILREELLGAEQFAGYSMFAGYFGHLYAGRGIDIIEALAGKHKNTAFLVFGGNEKDINSARESNGSKNLFIMGHIAPALVSKYMAAMDVLLMPYQKSVSIGLKAMDTSRWMSPMKMFEYMASGVPIISSKLPVLEEVLRSGENSLLVEPDRIDEWSSCLNHLEKDRSLGKKLAQNAYKECTSKYSWSTRAKQMVKAGAE